MFTDVAYILLFFFWLLVLIVDVKGYCCTCSQSINQSHTHTHTRTPLDDGSAQNRDFYRTTHNTQYTNIYSPHRVSNPQFQSDRSRSAPYIAWPPGLAVYEIQKRKISSTCSVAGCLLHDRHAVCSVASFSSCVPGRMFKRIDSNTSSHRSLKFSHSDYQLLQTATARFADINMNKYTNFKFHCFTVHFDTLRFIHTNSCNFSYNYVSVF